MWKLELAMAAFFPALLLGGAAMGREAFDESLRIAYAMAMLTMALMTARWGTSAGTAGALASLVIILGFAAMCAGVLTLQEENAQMALYHLAAGTSVALATAVTAAAAVLPGMSKPRQRRKGVLEGGILECGSGKNPGGQKTPVGTLKSARVRTAGELRDFTRDLPQDTRILFPSAEDENKTHEGIDSRSGRHRQAAAEGSTMARGRTPSPRPQRVRTAGESECCSLGRRKRGCSRYRKEP